MYINEKRNITNYIGNAFNKNPPKKRKNILL